MADTIARIRSGDLADDECATLGDLIAALLGLIDAENAVRRTADLQTDSATRLADSRARVDAQLTRLLATDHDPVL